MGGFGGPLRLEVHVTRFMNHEYFTHKCDPTVAVFVFILCFLSVVFKVKKVIIINANQRIWWESLSFCKEIKPNQNPPNSHYSFCFYLHTNISLFPPPNTYDAVSYYGWCNNILICLYYFYFIYKIVVNCSTTFKKGQKNLVMLEIIQI